MVEGYRAQVANLESEPGVAAERPTAMLFKRWVEGFKTENEMETDRFTGIDSGMSMWVLRSSVRGSGRGAAGRRVYRRSLWEPFRVWGPQLEGLTPNAHGEGR